jgi:3-mercaptopyruvate sulfurtransferase SseA
MNITVDELLALGENGATVINVSKHAGSKEIRGSIRYRPSDLLTADHLVLPIATELPLVLYTEAGDTLDTFAIAQNLTESGYPSARILEGGFKAYEAAGAPTQETSMEQIVPPSKKDEVQALDRRI